MGIRSKPSLRRKINFKPNFSWEALPKSARNLDFFGVPDPSLYSIYTDKKYYTRGLLKKRCSLDLLKANQHIVEKTMPNSVMNNVFCVVQNHEPPRHPIPGNAQALYIYPGTPLNGHPPNLLCTNYEKKSLLWDTLWRNKFPGE